MNRLGGHRSLSSTEAPDYVVSTGNPVPEEAVSVAEAPRALIVADALTYLRSTLRTPGAALTSPGAVKDYLRLNLADQQTEVFACIFLNGKHQILAFEIIFQGTVDAATVYPRELARRTLKHNAVALILAHNHPSGDVVPSQADKVLTTRLKEALGLLDVRILDHFIVGGSKEMQVLSMAEQGYM